MREEILNFVNRVKLGDLTDDEACARILWLFQSSQRVTRPDPKVYNIDPEGRRLIAAAIQSENMAKEILKVVHQAQRGDLTPDEAREAILRVFRAFPGVSMLYLGAQHIGDEGAWLIASGIESEYCSLKWLSLWYNNIGPQGAQYIANALQSPNCSIESFNLSGNKIGDVGAQYIADALLSPNCSIKSLGFNTINIGDVGAQSIANALLSPTCSIVGLDLSTNHIGNEGAQHLSLAIQSPQCPLKIIILAHNQIGPEGARHLATGIQHSDCTLQQLCLFSNNVGTEGAQHFIGALLDFHCSIQSLGLGEKNNIDPEILNATKMAAKRAAQRPLVRCLFELASVCLKLGLPRDPISIVLSFAGEGEIPAPFISKIVSNAQRWNSHFFILPSPPSWYGNLLRSVITAFLPQQAQARLLSDIILITRFVLGHGQENENSPPQVEILDDNDDSENHSALAKIKNS